MCYLYVCPQTLWCCSTLIVRPNPLILPLPTQTGCGIALSIHMEPKHATKASV